ncbi:MAG: hypothetical protein K5660_07190 [Paludibacteraceae bacterium]|nr:hypothetical protein [Paludibacteraceae bacterium]
MDFNELSVRSLRHHQVTPRIIINRMTGDILNWLRSIVCTNEEKAVYVLDGREMTDYQWFCQHLEEVPNGYIVFTHLSEIPSGKDAFRIKEMIRFCLRGYWRWWTMDGLPYPFSEKWMRTLAKKSKFIDIIIISERNEYKKSGTFKSIAEKDISFSYLAVSDNGFEPIKKTKIKTEQAENPIKE